MFIVAKSDFEVWNCKAISQFSVTQSNCEHIWSTSDIYFDTLIVLYGPIKLSVDVHLDIQKLDSPYSDPTEYMQSAVAKKGKIVQ